MLGSRRKRFVSRPLRGWQPGADACSEHRFPVADKQTRLLAGRACPCFVTDLLRGEDFACFALVATAWLVANETMSASRMSLALPTSVSEIGAAV